jgi:hypothetical protein
LVHETGWTLDCIMGLEVETFLLMAKELAALARERGR